MKGFARTVGFLGLMTGIVFLLSTADGCVSNLRKPAREYRIVGGQAQIVQIADKAPIPLENVHMVFFSSSCPSIRLSITETRGRLWQGKIEIPPDISSGNCTISVTYSDSNKSRQTYKLKIFPSKDALKRDSYSLFEKWTGCNPWLITALSFAFMAILMVVSYCIDERRGTYWEIGKESGPCDS